jgi:hypothetical protein
MKRPGLKKMGYELLKMVGHRPIGFFWIQTWSQPAGLPIKVELLRNTN